MDGPTLTGIADWLMEQVIEMLLIDAVCCQNSRRFTASSDEAEITVILLLTAQILH